MFGWRRYHQLHGRNGLDVSGGPNLHVGDSGGNTFQDIGGYGIHLGTNSWVRTLTSGSITIENNVFGDTNILGSSPIPIISIGSPAIKGSISKNQFHSGGKYPISLPYVRYGVE